MMARSDHSAQAAVSDYRLFPSVKSRLRPAKPQGLAFQEMEELCLKKVRGGKVAFPPRSTID